MKSQKVGATAAQILDPGGSLWSGVSSQEVRLQPTPVDAIPSKYVHDTLDPRSVGKTQAVHVKSVHTGSEIFFRLEWTDETKDTDVSQPHLFPDAAAILFPMKGDAPLPLMGSKIQPVNAWYWRADEEKPFNVTAAGLGTTERSRRSFLRAKGNWEGRKWRVVIGRPLKVEEQKDETIQLAVGDTVKVAFAVWEGRNKERHGAKSFSGHWYDLEITT
ncbi:MAG: ethylbenzene dehydrogenase-related protein [Candidatus Binatia bacterium]